MFYVETPLNTENSEETLNRSSSVDMRGHGAGAVPGACWASGQQQSLAWVHSCAEGDFNEPVPQNSEGRLYSWGA